MTADLAIGLRTTLDIAEQVKIKYASTLPDQFGKSEKLDLSEVGAVDSELVSLRFVAEIVQARLAEILEKIDRELTKVGRSGMLPAGVVLTGGGAKVAGLVELSKKVLRLPVVLGYPLGITSYTDRVNDLSYTTAIGLVQWGMNEAGPGNAGHSFSGFKAAEKAMSQFKRMFGIKT